MQIPGASNSLYGAASSSTKNEFLPSDKPNEPMRSQDEVTLSPEARKAFEKLAMYSGQAGKYLPKVNVLNNADSHKIGYPAWASDFRNTYKTQLNEYSSKFHDYYNDTKAEHGIETASDHYEKVIQAEKGDDFTFQQSFEDKLKSDPRMLELMDILGIKKPT